MRAIARSIPPSRRPASDRFLQGDQARQVQGADVARTRWPIATTTRTRWCSASGWRTTSAPPSPTGTPSPGKAATRSAAAPSTGRGSARAWRAPSSRPTSPSSCSTCSTRRSSASTTPTSPPRATASPRATRTSAPSPTSSPRRCRSARTKLLWGTANLFSNRRYMAGAATNPDPDVFAYAAGQVKNVLEVTHELGGANYVLWGGREGYETLLNTNIKQEADQAARFLSLVIEHAKKIGFKGTHPDRAEAAGADQAPVRLRRRDGLRLPQDLRPREGGEGQHRGRPRLPRRPLLRARAGAGRARSASSARSTPTATTCSRAGTPTSSPTTPARWRSPSTRSSSTAASATAASTSTPRCAASRSIRPTCSTAMSAASTCSPAASRRAAAMIEDGTYDKVVEDALRRLEGAREPRPCSSGKRTPRADRRAGRKREHQPAAAAPASRNISRTWSTGSCELTVSDHPTRSSEWRGQRHPLLRELAASRLLTAAVVLD